MVQAVVGSSHIAHLAESPGNRGFLLLAGAIVGGVGAVLRRRGAIDAALRPRDRFLVPRLLLDQVPLLRSERPLDVLGKAAVHADRRAGR